MPVTITGTGEPGADVIAHIYIGNQTACTPDESGSSACSEATDGETRTEVGDDGAAYGVEIRLPNGNEVEVHLNGDCQVTGQEADD